MKETSIARLPVDPVSYNSESYDQISWKGIDSEMEDGQRRFVHGLISYYKPRRILELGVSEGGSTVAIVKAALGCEEGTEVHSIDIVPTIYRSPFLPTGHCVRDYYGDRADDIWKLHIGEPAEVLRKLNLKFDFCVIDTMHAHPAETLNFIAALPYLNDGAITIMHDTTAYAWFDNAMVDCFMHMFAPRLLLSSVCAEKLIPNLPSGNMDVSNIAAWQVNEDTRKYCDNLFDVLYMPWEMMVEKSTIDAVQKVVEEKYNSSLLSRYKEAVDLNKEIYLERKGKRKFSRMLSLLPSNTIFYGAGRKMKELLAILDAVDISFPFRIWDRDAERIGSIYGKDVHRPDYNTMADEGQRLIVMIEDITVFEEVKWLFSKLGYTVVHGIE